MRASFLTASLAGLAALSAVANFSPAQAQDSISVDKCYDAAVLTEQLAGEGQQKVIPVVQIPQSVPVDFYMNLSDGTGYVIKHSNCQPEITAASTQSRESLVPVIKFDQGLLLDRNDPASFERIKGGFNEEEALAQCKQTNLAACLTYNGSIAKQKETGYGPMLQARTLVLKDGVYNPGPLITVSSKISGNGEGGLLATLKYGASVIKMAFTQATYTKAAEEYLNKPAEVASIPYVATSAGLPPQHPSL